MSNAIFPIFPGLTFPAIRTPEWDTIVQRAASGKEVRLGLFQNPVWHWELHMSVLRSNFTPSGFTASEWATFLGFYLSRTGAYDTFLFVDPDDNAVTDQAMGTGDGSTQSFQLVRSFNADFREAIQSPAGTPVIKLNGTPTVAFSINTGTGIITFSSPPGIGVAITWTGSYYFRVRFEEDKMDLSKFTSKMWEPKVVKLVSVIV